MRSKVCVLCDLVFSEGGPDETAELMINRQDSQFSARSSGQNLHQV